MPLSPHLAPFARWRRQARGRPFPRGYDGDTNFVRKSIITVFLHDGINGLFIHSISDFAKLTKAQRRIYDHRGDTCDGAYADDTGSMQAMQSAMCREELAVTYFKASGSGIIKGNPRWKGPAPASQ
jgi:hypothetical protein